MHSRKNLNLFKPFTAAEQPEVIIDTVEPAANRRYTSCANVVPTISIYGKEVRFPNGNYMTQNI